MSEENQGTVDKTTDDVGHKYSFPAPDYLIQDYVAWANLGVSVGITISVKGVVFTGKIISGAQWCAKHINEIESSNTSDEIKDAIKKFYGDLKESHYSSPEKANNGQIGFIHLDEARIISGKSISEFNMCWRFRISEIDGFSIGLITAQ